MVSRFEAFSVRLCVSLAILYCWLSRFAPLRAQSATVAMPHEVPNFLDPSIKELVLWVWDRHRHDAMNAEGKTVVKKGKYRDACAELAKNWNLVVQPQFLKDKVVSALAHTLELAGSIRSAHQSVVPALCRDCSRPTTTMQGGRSGRRLSTLRS
jgi:hypothetical protein